MKLLTIVIPAYNVEAYIDRCLSSMCLDDPACMDQLEILVVDDGGEDRTGEIAAGYCERYPESIFFCHKENGGHGSVINYGIKRARGRYFKVVDGDDWLNSRELPGLLDLLAREPADIVASAYRCVEDESGRLLSVKKPTGCEENYGHAVSFDSGQVDQVIKMHSMTIKTSLLQGMGQQIDEHCFYVDAEYIAYPIPLAKNVYYDAREIYCYRLGRGGQSMSLKSMQKNHRMHRRVFDSLAAFYERLPDMSGIRRHYIACCCAQLLENEFQIYISMGNRFPSIDRLRRFDRGVRLEHPAIYGATDKKSIRLLRACNYLILPLAYLVLRIKKAKAFR